MESRSSFEARLNTIVNHRLHAAKNPQEESLWLLDVFCAAAFFCARIVDPQRGPRATLDLIVNRLEKVKDMIIAAREGSSGSNGHVEGDPHPPRIITP